MGHGIEHSILTFIRQRYLREDGKSDASIRNGEFCDYLRENNLIANRSFLLPIPDYCHPNLEFLERYRDIIVDEFKDNLPRSIEIDCFINQLTRWIMDGGISIEETSEYERLSSYSDSDIFEYFRRMDHNDSAPDFLKSRHSYQSDEYGDDFMRNRNLIVREFFSSKLVVINRGPIDEFKGEFNILVGNGFTIEVVHEGTSFQTLSIYERTFGIDEREEHHGIAMKDEYDRTTKTVNTILDGESAEDIQRKIDGLDGQILNHLREILIHQRMDGELETANRLVINTCRNHLVGKGSNAWSRNDRLDLLDFSIEEILYLWQIFNEPPHLAAIEKQLGHRKLKARFMTNIQKAIFMSGAAINPKNIDKKKVGSHRFGTHLVKHCFTTNYDTYCDWIFKTDVVHLHGSFCHYKDGAIVRRRGFRQIKRVEREFSKGHLSHILVDVKDKALDIFDFETEFEQLKSFKGSLIVFGFSGDFDAHVMKILRENEGISEIIYCQYELNQMYDESAIMAMRRNLALKFTKYNRKITIIDSGNLRFQRNGSQTVQVRNEN